MHLLALVRAVGNAWEFIEGYYTHALMGGEAWDLLSEDWEFSKLI
jgi:hypothetical protein